MYKLPILFFLLFIFSCKQRGKNDFKKLNNNNKPDTFTLKEVDIALIYESRINGIPCLLHNVTDTLKENENVGVIFKFDVSYDNPRKSNGCCAFEPGVGGTKNKIRNVKIRFKNNNSSLDVSSQLFNNCESQMRNQYEDYIQSQFIEDDFICVCSEQKTGELIEYVNKKHIEKSYSERIDSTKLSILHNIDEFKKWYNHFTGLKYSGNFKDADTGWKLTSYYFYFWIPNEMKQFLKEYDSVEISIEFENGKILKNKRIIINEV